jgi:DNA-binding SARP family transcriptional activator
MASSMEFCLLGALLVRRDAAALPVSSGKQRVLLAALLLRANAVVRVDDLARDMWDGSPPPSARASLQTYVMRLRKALGADGHRRIVAQPDGYLIRVEAGELDVDLFAARLAAAQEDARAGRYAEAAAGLEAALGLWRGEPLADVPSETLALRELPRLDELRLQALECHISARLRLGRHAEVIAELRQLTSTHPLRERLHALLMLALAGSGQRADALAAYRAVREVLVDELGIEPGPELRELQRQILADDTADCESAGLPVPRQLPGAVPAFAGRSAELARLAGLLEAATVGETVMVFAIAGPAGIGKTALAVHWAHQLAGRYPDGQLYLNLRGFGPSGPPMSPGEATRNLLQSLAVSPDRIPASPDASAALYRSCLAGRRMLILLDNARDPGQVRRLLPGHPGCLVVVTSRDHLAGLVAADGARLLVVDKLEAGPAREMLAGRLGQDRVAAETDAVAELTALCVGLPLALGIVAARAAARPGLSLAVLAAELRDARSRLDWLSTGEAVTDMRTVFSWSLQQLTPPAMRMFQMLGLHPGPDITVPAAASLAGVPPGQARAALAELARAHLLTEGAPGRHSCHDLLRAYATELVG